MPAHFKSFYAFLVSISLLYVPHAFAQSADQDFSEMAGAIIRFEAGWRDINRSMQDVPLQLIRTRNAYLHQWEDSLQSVHFDRLSQEGKIDFILLQYTIQRNLDENNQQQQVWTVVRKLLPLTDSIFQIAGQRHVGNQLNARHTAAIFDAFGKTLQRNARQIDLTDLSDMRLAYQVLQAVDHLHEILQDVYQFYNEYDPAFTWWMQTTYRFTDSVFSVYTDSLRAAVLRKENMHDQSGIHGVPIGREELMKLLHDEMIPYTPEELIDIANREYNWCLQQIKKASAAMGYGDDWKKALEKVKESYVPPGEQPQVIRALEEEAVQFVQNHHLVTIPDLAKQTWTMEMMSPRRQLVNPFFTGGDVLSISYPTNSMSYADKMMSMRGNNPYFSRATVFHEIIPGHYLQEYMNERYRSYRWPFHTAFWTEGWAFYWEMLLWDKGYDQTPEQKIGALFWRMHRCARIVFSINFHLGKWTPEQCVEYLIDKVGHERANAEGEVRRSFEGGYGPLYQLAYMIGALQFYALHHELVDSGKMTDQDFHDAVLKEGNMPVEMVRAALEHTPLKRDYQPQWRFYQEIGR
ncbi:uncharacterized protein (DUF885 family) [Thermoflavifilum aggregans]|uniref:Uncharacterized protein (DUF885 family) n=1 Tax=Thermoflavifilum aggregans TaxID=454188 RepID=A0A2M9CTI6_9BACT|nr:DUF885 family protein [Thermoflavifilum aggregans]PJJ75227.1 uncharacterized protein (DUF885 family) [Thermoflavifilum aggregans]